MKKIVKYSILKYRKEEASMTRYDYEQIVKDCNEECLKCRKEYEKAKIEFQYDMCKLCLNGQKLHRAEFMISETERKWGECDWNSSLWEEYYHS